MKSFLPLRPKLLAFSVAVCVTSIWLIGCASDSDVASAVATFQQASATLQQAYQTLVNNANQIEETKYIQDQAFDSKTLTLDAIKKADILTADEIKLRQSAIKALSDYTTALSTLAAGKSAASIEADANTASSSLKTLTTDLGTAMKAPSAKTTQIAGPISSAVAAAGEVIDLIEKHKGVSEVKASLAKNDPQVTVLFQAIQTESAALYDRQKSSSGATGDQLFADYNKAVEAKASSVELLELSDRIKNYQAGQSSLGSADPVTAVAGFQKAHDALIKLVFAPKDQKKQSLADVIAAVKAFASEVTPLAQDLEAFAKAV